LGAARAAGEKWAGFMRLSPEVVKGKLGIICFDSRTFGVLDIPSAESDASASPILRPAPLGLARLEPEPRLGATSVLYAGFSV
jgi:hypothetical protein